MSAELAARRTAAAAVLADYKRDAETTDMTGRALWAARLADMLMFLLFELNALDKAGKRFPRAASQIAEIRLVLDAFDWETDDRQYALEAIDRIVREYLTVRVLRDEGAPEAADIAHDRPHPGGTL